MSDTNPKLYRQIKTNSRKGRKVTQGDQLGGQ